MGQPLLRAQSPEVATHLASEVFISFAEDLLGRLMLFLDALLDLENHRKLSRWSTDHAEVNRVRDLLRKQVAQDKQQIEAHIQLMLRYLSGQLMIDLYPAQIASTLRFVLDEKYKAYCELTAQDEALTAQLERVAPTA